jgi:hypothetical protein
MNKENREVGNQYGLRNRERNNRACEEEENEEGEVQEEEEDDEGRKVENGRDNVLMRYTTRILKRIRTMTVWRCQEN